MERLKNLSLWIFFGLLAYMPLHILLSTLLGSSFGVLDFTKIFKDIVLFGGFLLALIAGIGQPWFKQLLKDKLVWLIAIYAALTLLMAALRPTDSDAEILAVVYNLRFLLFFIYGMLLARLYDREKVFLIAIRLVMAVGAAVLFFGIVQYVLLPDGALTHVGYSRESGVLPAFFIDDKPDLERVMSTLRDPNSLGSYIIIVLTIALSYFLATKNRDYKRSTAAYLVLGTLCLWFTFSRSAWLGMVLAALVVVAYKIFQNKKPAIDKKYILIAATGVVLIFGGVYLARNSYLVRNVVFHADEKTVLEDPNELRIRRWHESIVTAVLEPAGYGPGTAGLASIRNEKQGTVLNENYYLQLLYEVGFPGLILFLLIIISVIKRLYLMTDNNPAIIALFAAFIGLALTNMLVHIWSNEAVAYTWWGLAGLVLTTTKTKKRS